MENEFYQIEVVIEISDTQKHGGMIYLQSQLNSYKRN